MLSIYINKTIILGNDEHQIMVTANELKVSRENNSIELHITAVPNAFEKIDKSCLFGLQQENRGPILGGEFEDGKNFYLNLKLKKKLNDDFIDFNQDEAFFRESMVTSSSEITSTIFHSLDSWNALSVTQDMDVPANIAGKGSVGFGFNTIWSDLNPPKSQLVDYSHQLETLLLEQEVEFQKYTDRDVWKIQVNHPKESWICQIHLMPEVEMIMVVSHRPKTIPLDSIVLLNEYIARLNYGLVSGGAGVNMDTGELYFKVSGPLVNSESFEATIDFLLRQSTHMYANYLTEVDSLLDETISPKDFLQAREETN